MVLFHCTTWLLIPRSGIRTYLFPFSVQESSVKTTIIAHLVKCRASLSPLTWKEHHWTDVWVNRLILPFCGVVFRIKRLLWKALFFNPGVNWLHGSHQLRILWVYGPHAFINSCAGSGIFRPNGPHHYWMSGWASEIYSFAARGEVWLSTALYCIWSCPCIRSNYSTI